MKSQTRGIVVIGAVLLASAWGMSVAAVGGPDMPVWGDAFLRTTDGGSEETVRLKIEALVWYLESVQARQGV